MIRSSSYRSVCNLEVRRLLQDSEHIHTRLWSVLNVSYVSYEQTICIMSLLSTHLFALRESVCVFEILEGQAVIVSIYKKHRVAVWEPPSLQI